MTDSTQPLQSCRLLCDVNPHERDKRIEFINEGHIYKIDGGNDIYKSVTTFIKSFFNPFNADMILGRMKRAGTFDAKYGSKSIEDVKNEWKALGKEAADLGTVLHAQIEAFYNAQDTKKNLSDISKEYVFFENFNREHVIENNMKPYRTEWYIFHEDFRIAGSIDMVFELPSGNLAIYDWKRSKKIGYRNSSKAKYPIKHIDDCNFYHYALQLNLYKFILENKYEKQIEKLCLVFLHPINESYILVDVPDLQNEISLMLRLKSAV